jgi:RimJ/RimL family protein N-acetyltransferase
MQAPEHIDTSRLILRRPRAGDVEPIFSRYAGDPDVTRWLGWPRHESLDHTRMFLAFSDAEWTRWPAGPYLVESRDNGQLLGSTGFGFETPERAATGYVFAKDAWGKGYATESLLAIVRIACDLSMTRLHACCHVANPASWRVLEKCGFVREGDISPLTFPNLAPDESRDAVHYALALK